VSDIDIKLRELVLGGQAYQARELAHALDLAEWADLLDLLLDHWRIEVRLYLYMDTFTSYQLFYPQHTDEQWGRLVKYNARLMLTSKIGDCFSVRYKAVRLCRHVLRTNPDIKARVAEAAA